MIVFEPLQMDQRNDVARIQVLELTEQLLSQALGLSLTEQALDVLVREGFDPLYGARPMRRVIQKRLEHPLAEALLAGLFSLVTTLLLMRVMKVSPLSPKRCPRAQTACR